jgi:trigger factor
LEDRRYTPATVETTLEHLDGDRVRLTVAVAEDEFDVAVDAAFRKIAREVRLPGFRPGKAPRKLLEARLGKSTGRQEALHDALPDYYSRALVEHDVDAIASPEIEITGGQETGSLTFDAVVPVRPRATVAGHGSLRIEIPAPEATDEDVEQQLDALRHQHATLEAVERPADDGDQVTIDIDGRLDDEPVEGLTTNDYLYEVGAGAVVPEIDENLRGASAGDVLEFEAAHPEEDGTLAFRIVVSKVQARVLPELNDDFAAQASEFDTFVELEVDIRERITGLRRSQAGMMARERTAQAVADLVDMDVPPALVEVEIDNRINDMAIRMRSQGFDLSTYLEATGSDLESVRDELREGAEVSARVDLGLRAVAEAEGLEADGEPLEKYLMLLAAQAGGEVEDLRTALTESGRILEIRADLRKQAALDWVFDRAEIVDEEGNPVDRSLLESPEPEIVVPDDDEPIPTAADEVGETSSSASDLVDEEEE